VVRYEPEERRERLGGTTEFGIGQLQDGLGVAAQTSTRDGTSWPRPPAWLGGGGRNLLGGEEKGVVGRLTEDKALIAVAAEEDGKGIGRIRLRRIPDTTRVSLHGFIAESIKPGSTVRTDGLNAYLGLVGYVHDRQVQRRQPEGEHLMPRVHRVISLLKRWLLGTHQGAIGHEYLDYYLDEFTFRFNRRTSASRGKLFLPVGPAGRPSFPGYLCIIDQNHNP